MGTLLDGLYDHEGYGAQRLADGTYSPHWVGDGEFVAYVASCECSLSEYRHTTWRGGEYPPTEAGEEAALAEWQRMHAGPLLAARRVEDEADAARHADALRTAGLIDPYSDGPNVEAIIGTWWHRDGPHSADRIVAAGLAIDELTHYLARATSTATLPGPRVYRLISELRSALGRLDQVAGQLSTRIGQLAEDPTLYDDRGRDHDPAVTAREAQGGLDAARVALGPLTAALAAAHSASGHLGHDT